jgi:hypothetical protein
MHLQLPTGESLFIHVPKTGGNSVQQALIAHGLSRDHFHLSGHQDGVERFDLRGAITHTKHQALRAYEAQWPAAAHCPVFVGMREPLDRLISFYFSPHRWFRHDAATGCYQLPAEAPFVPEAFIALVNNSPSACDWLADGQPGSAQPNQLAALEASGRLTLLRTESLATDVERAFGIALALTPRNVSPYHQQARDLSKSSELRSLVNASHHDLDRQLYYS